MRIELKPHIQKLDISTGLTKYNYDADIKSYFANFASVDQENKDRLVSYFINGVSERKDSYYKLIEVLFTIMPDIYLDQFKAIISNTTGFDWSRSTTGRFTLDNYKRTLLGKINAKRDYPDCFTGINVLNQTSPPFSTEAADMYNEDSKLDSFLKSIADAINIYNSNNANVSKIIIEYRDQNQKLIAGTEKCIFTITNLKIICDINEEDENENDNINNLIAKINNSLKLAVYIIEYDETNNKMTSIQLHNQQQFDKYLFLYSYKVFKLVTFNFYNTENNNCNIVSIFNNSLTINTTFFTPPFYLLFFLFGFKRGQNYPFILDPFMSAIGECVSGIQNIERVIDSSNGRTKYFINITSFNETKTTEIFKQSPKGLNLTYSDIINFKELFGKLFNTDFQINKIADLIGDNVDSKGNTIIQKGGMITSNNPRYSGYPGYSSYNGNPVYPGYSSYSGYPGYPGYSSNSHYRSSLFNQNYGSSYRNQLYNPNYGRNYVKDNSKGSNLSYYITVYMELAKGDAASLGQQIQAKCNTKRDNILMNYYTLVGKEYSVMPNYNNIPDSYLKEYSKNDKSRRSYYDKNKYTRKGSVGGSNKTKKTKNKI